MVRDLFEEVGEVCMDKFVYNENVVAQMSYEPEDYIVDDESEWYNFIYDCEQRCRRLTFELRDVV